MNVKISNNKILYTFSCHFKHTNSFSFLNWLGSPCSCSNRQANAYMSWNITFLQVVSNHSVLSNYNMTKVRSIHNSTSLNAFKIQSIWSDQDDHRLTEKQFLIKESDDHPAKLVTFQQEQLLNVKLEEKHKTGKEITDDEWDDIKTSVLRIEGAINEENIDAIIMNKCGNMNSLQLGKSYYKYMKNLGSTINRATYGNYLRLFYLFSSQCTNEDLKEIESVYKELMKLYPLIDYYTTAKVICGISLTSSWRDYEKLLKVNGISYNPGPFLYSVIIKSAFRNSEFDLGWKLAEEMQLKSLNTPDDVYVLWLDVIKNTKDEEIGIQRLFQFVNNFNLKLSLSVCEILEQIFARSHPNYKGTWTSVTRRGVCKNCQWTLESAWVNQEDYDQLKTAFLNPVLIGKDIFQKTQPEEFSEFLKFIKKTAPYDVVLDGLNIAMNVHKSKRSPSAFAFQLKSMVTHFTAQQKKVLVIGRKHMNKWPKQYMEVVFDSAEVFLAEDISQDDPFMLYATLYSGLGTRFVSRDMMRSHKFLLTNPKLQATFQKWQTQHQFFLKYIEGNGIVHLQNPVPFMQTIQQSAHDSWHIPYDVKEDFTNKKVYTDNFHRNWLCLVNESSQKLVSPNYSRVKQTQYNRKKAWEDRSTKDDRQHRFRREW